MNASTPPHHEVPLAVDGGELPAGETRAEQTMNERLCHLFRVSLKNGRVHPLYLPILKYRHAGGAR